MKKFLLSMLGVLLALPGFARDFTYEYEGQTLTYTVIDEDAKTCMTKNGDFNHNTWNWDAGNAVSGILVIPPVAKDGDTEYSVVIIGSYGFYGCHNLTSVIIPNSVEIIDFDAFYGCRNLTSVIIPNSVDIIRQDAFQGCEDLKKSAYPSGISNPFRYGITVEYPREGAIIENGFVYGPEKNAIYFAPLSLEGNYIVPESVTSIGDNAFSGCSTLTSVTIADNLTSIGDEAFSGCSALTSVKAVAANPPIMNDNSFDGLYATAVLSVPENAVNNYMFTNWCLFENITSGDNGEALKTYETGNLKYSLTPAQSADGKNLAVVIPGNYSSLTEVTIPERFTVSESGNNVRYYVDGIGFKAFNGCSNLKTVTINSRNASRIIGDYAFSGTNISSLSIPETVETIGSHAFDGCLSLASIVIPGSVKTIGNYAFSECAKLKNVEIPEKVTTIGSYAFNNCTSLTEITIPGSVESVGDYAFNRCTALTNANLEAGVRIIGDYAFSRTNALNKITLNEGLESIGANAFLSGEKKYVGPIYIPSTVKSIGKDAFDGFSCKYVNISNLASWCNIDFGSAYSNPARLLYLNGEKIENLVIPASVDSISDYAFYNMCNNLSALVIPGNVTYIGYRAFGYTPVKDVAVTYGTKPITIEDYGFPDEVVTLSWDRPGKYLRGFYVEKLTIGNSVTEIPAATFKGASKLTSLTLGNSLTAIGDEAFSGCTALTQVILPPSVETIGASAFAGNSKLTSIIMGHNVQAIGEKAYDLCPAQTVSITAQTPPEAPDNTFSNYTGKLYVQGQEAAKAYYDADYCWYQFEGHVMIEPTEFKVEGNKVLSGKPGDTFQLKATLYPTDVTLPHVFWRSTNPEIATVDANGLVTLHADMSEIMTLAEGDDASYRSCKIIAESLYANGPVAEFTVNNDNSGIDDIVFDSSTSGDIDFTTPVEVYNLQGVMVSDNVENLANGIYIVRQGKNVKKIAVK